MTRSPLTLASPDLDPSGHKYRDWQPEEKWGRGLRSRCGWRNLPRHKRSPVRRRRRPWGPARQPPQPKGGEAGPAALSSTEGHALEAEARVGGPTRVSERLPTPETAGTLGPDMSVTGPEHRAGVAPSLPRAVGDRTPRALQLCLPPLG